MGTEAQGLGVTAVSAVAWKRVQIFVDDKLAQLGIAGHTWRRGAKMNGSIRAMRSTECESSCASCVI